MKSTRTRLHVVGCHRSGTTLMMELLWSCYALGGRCEHEQSLFAPVPEGDGVFLTKKPPDTIRIEPVFLRDPNLYLVAMLRDPRAVVTSRHPVKPDVYFSSFHRWRAYAEVLERLQHHPRCIVVRYETLLEYPQEEQHRIERGLSFLRRQRQFQDYPHPEQVSEKAQMSLNGVRPFDVSRLDGWRSHLPRVKDQVERYPEMVEWLVRLGYESDDAWLDDLTDVVPVQQDYKDVPPHLGRRLESSLRFWLKRRRYARLRGL